MDRNVFKKNNTLCLKSSHFMTRVSLSTKEMFAQVSDKLKVLDRAHKMCIGKHPMKTSYNTPPAFIISPEFYLFARFVLFFVDFFFFTQQEFNFP